MIRESSSLQEQSPRQILKGYLVASNLEGIELAIMALEVAKETSVVEVADEVL